MLEKKIEDILRDLKKKNETDIRNFKKDLALIRLDKKDINSIIRELKKEGIIEVKGRRKKKVKLKGRKIKL